jgi:hypothetical protein
MTSHHETKTTPHPSIGPYNSTEMTITLLRDGKEQQYHLIRSSIKVVMPEPENEIAHFLSASLTTSPEAAELIWLTMNEAALIEKRLGEIEADEFNHNQEAQGTSICYGCGKVGDAYNCECGYDEHWEREQWENFYEQCW